MENSEAMETAENSSNEFLKLHDQLEELKGKFEDVWASIDIHENYNPDYETKFKKCSWDLACALGALQEASDLMYEAYDFLDESEG
jgi:hypothetical protein